MFFFYGIFGLLGPLVGLVLVGASVHVIWRTVTLPRRTRLGAVCERCKYDVAELATFTCPECGEDLRRVGIVTPAMEARRRGSLPGAIIAWTFLCGLVAYLGVMGAFMWSFSGRMTSAVSGWQQTLTPGSGAYRSLTVDFESDGMTISGETELVLTMTDGATHPLTIDPAMQVYGVGGRVVEWSADTIGEWYREIGLDTTDRAVAAEAAEVSRFIDLLNMSPSSAYNPNLVHHRSGLTVSGGITAAPDPLKYGLVLLGALGVLALAYILGLLFIVRRRRRLLRGVGAV